jgi:hypothetical protein
MRSSARGSRRTRSGTGRHIPFARRQFASEGVIAAQHLAESHEGPHTFDVHLDRPRAPKDGRGHRHSLLGECMGQVLPMLPAPSVALATFPGGVLIRRSP